MKRFFLFVTTVLWVTLSAFAREQNVIAVYQMDGQKALFAFAVKKLQFEKADMPEGIDEVETDKRFSFRDGSIVIEGGQPNRCS